MKVGLVGEKLEIYSDVGARKVQWNKFVSSANQTRPLTWYKVYVNVGSTR